jgi:hypothetical protein
MRGQAPAAKAQSDQAMSCKVTIASIAEVQLVELQHYFEANGDLIVMERVDKVPFEIERVFVVRAPDRAIRGKHAHKRCAQFLVCTNGCVEVICDDGLKTARFVLNRPELGLVLPPSIWSEQTYQGAESVLTVLCDRPYEAADYIRDYQEFLSYRKAAGVFGP